MDGTTPFKVGHLDYAPELLSEMSLSINGQALLIKRGYEHKKSIIFDVQTGKMIVE